MRIEVSLKLLYELRKLQEELKLTLEKNRSLEKENNEIERELFSSSSESSLSPSSQAQEPVRTLTIFGGRGGGACRGARDSEKGRGEEAWRFEGRRREGAGN